MRFIQTVVSEKPGKHHRTKASIEAEKDKTIRKTCKASCGFLQRTLSCFLSLERSREKLFPHQFNCL